MKNKAKTQESITEYILRLEAKVKGLETEVQLLNNKLKAVLELAAMARAKQFGKSSEKLNPDQIMLFNEAEFLDELSTEETINESEITGEIVVEEVEVKIIKKKKQPGFKDEKFKDLPTEVIEYTLPSEKCSCPECGNKLHNMGTKVRKELIFKPAQYSIIEHVEHVYSCRNCEKNETSTPILKAKAPKALIPKSVASASLVSNIIINKYMAYVPLDRQERLLYQIGIEISKQCMARWIITVAKNYLQPIYDKLQVALRNQDYIHVDETVVQVLKEPDKRPESNSYIWLYRSGKHERKQVVLYEYQPDRKKIRPQNFLEGFKGTVHSDGYKGYHSLKNVTISGCLAHLRRRFDGIVKVTPQKHVVGSPGFIGLGYCKKLYDIEREIRDLTPDEIKKIRQERSTPLFRSFFTWIKNTPSHTGTALDKAFIYALNQQEYLETFLNDGYCEIDNNRAERSIKPFVIGRKNFLFCDTVNGANASAIIYSLVETAKENNLNAAEYLNYLLTEMPGLNYTESPDSLDRLLPWSELPESCYLKKKE